MPFVGVFLARISRGPNIRGIVDLSFFIPMIYCVVWFGTFGDSAIRMHRKADLLVKAGKELHGDANEWLAKTTSNRPVESYYDVPVQLALCPSEPDSMSGDDWEKAT